ncbi:4-alpha-glucanotransferase [Lyngbya confervoides]|uniref:4-alpha-glucanotransferase n=1 Tax=Lyngbya confervoides BDU141951 TaxID=1574623 RepID=A0ABD4T554_9CYAN|nr:4-alpha-glucanotransferase [Lyngbya confervoides]MCM1983837.1 4-alpha-glucanotransferase [Lyngbya confervoides BDU141951]
MPFPRSSGIILHPTSLPSPFGIGDLGRGAYEFVDFLAHSAQQIWQVLPLGPVSYGDSPYMTYSSMAGNPLLVSPEILVEDGFLRPEDLAAYPKMPSDRVKYDEVSAAKRPLFQIAAHNFQQSASPAQRQEFQAFCQEQAYWLDDYVFYMAYRESQGGKSWHLWDTPIANRHPEAIAQAKAGLESAIFYHTFLQYEFFRQWANLKAYANQKGIQILGDIPIYVAHDSVDVWAHPDNYYLDRQTAEPELMAGVPPDYFSETGQLWGNPIYKWRRLELNGYDWWIQRFRATLTYVDLVRIDHFRAFAGFWIVEQGEDDARRGAWMPGPGERFFKVLRDKLGGLPIIAEDLGVITPDVIELRDAFDFPGMKILQFAFGEGRCDDYFPTNFPDENCVVYTGTHDNDTTVGWFNKFEPQMQEDIMTGLETLYEEDVPDLRELGDHWVFIWLAMQSIANQAIFPLQDILGLDSEARMNTPSSMQGNWAWRFPAGALTSALGDRLREITLQCNRGLPPA